jgi:hypothetical protein
LSENGLGYNLGDFFTSASGHPDPNLVLIECGAKKYIEFMSSATGCFPSPSGLDILSNVIHRFFKEKSCQTFCAAHVGIKNAKAALHGGVVYWYGRRLRINGS